MKWRTQSVGQLTCETGRMHAVHYNPIVRKLTRRTLTIREIQQPKQKKGKKKKTSRVLKPKENQFLQMLNSNTTRQSPQDAQDPRCRLRSKTPPTRCKTDVPWGSNRVTAGTVMEWWGQEDKAVVWGPASQLKGSKIICHWKKTLTCQNLRQRIKSAKVIK